LDTQSLPATRTICRTWREGGPGERRGRQAPFYEKLRAGASNSSTCPARRCPGGERLEASQSIRLQEAASAGAPRRSVSAMMSSVETCA